MFRSPTSTNTGSINGQGRKPADINNPEVQAKIGNRATKRVNNHAASKFKLKYTSVIRAKIGNN